MVANNTFEFDLDPVMYNVFNKDMYEDVIKEVKMKVDLVSNFKLDLTDKLDEADDSPRIVKLEKKRTNMVNKFQAAADALMSNMDTLLTELENRPLSAFERVTIDFEKCWEERLKRAAEERAT